MWLPLRVPSDQVRLSSYSPGVKPLLFSEWFSQVWVREKRDRYLWRSGKQIVLVKNIRIEEISQWLVHSASKAGPCFRNGTEEHFMEENRAFRKLGLCPEQWSLQRSRSLVDSYWIENLLSFIPRSCLWLFIHTFISTFLNLILILVYTGSCSNTSRMR